ncbi:GSCOCG00011274001-RA-CDS [Cotesia congregata]|nr:GSCOCG00011274001-RA-CDS [Cotesia congregata]
MEFFIDFEGFYTLDGSFIVKELAVISLSDEVDFLSTAAVATFEPPAEYTNEFMVLETKDFLLRSHGIRWDEGSFFHNELEEVLRETLKHKTYVYVLGEEKKHWLEKEINFSAEVIDLSKMRFINHLKDFDPIQPCLLRKNHSKKSNYACAYETVQRMKRWFLSCWGLSPSLEKSLQLFYQFQSLAKMDPQDIACLDKSFILQFTKHEINAVWSKLPHHMKIDSRFIDYTRCTEHYKTMYNDVLDGPYPLKKDCYECNNKSFL